MDRLKEIHGRFRDRAAFLLVYIREAHPEDEWQMDANEEEGVCYRQPRTLAERVAVANDFVRRYGLEIPVAVDGVDDRANEAYAGWPERIYVIDETRSIAYKGKRGPFGYRPEEVAGWLERRFPSGAGPAVNPGRE